MTTVRRYPRTAAEAFKDEPYARAIEGPTRAPGYGSLWWLCVAVIAAASAVIVWATA